MKRGGFCKYVAQLWLAHKGAYYYYTVRNSTSFNQPLIRLLHHTSHRGVFNIFN